jgi:hypothetical protein
MKRITIIVPDSDVWPGGAMKLYNVICDILAMMLTAGFYTATYDDAPEDESHDAA